MAGGWIRTKRVASIVALALAGGACGVPDNGPWMQPGQNCLSCHNPNGRAYGNPWTLGGTVFTDSSADAGVEGAQIVIVDARGQAITLISNGAGNFYTGEALQAPFKSISVGVNGQWIPMPSAYFAPGTLPNGQEVDGACNYCHNQNGFAGLAIYAPLPDGGTPL